MDKILQWLEKSIIYSFDNNEPIFDKYFKIITNDGSTISPKNIEMGYDKCTVNFDAPFQAIMINGVVFVRPIDVVEIKSETKTIKDVGFTLPEEPEEPIPPIVIYSKVGSVIYAENTGETTIETTANVKHYFKEAYPDFAEYDEDIKLKIPTGKSKILEGSNDKITVVTIDGNTFELEFKPSFYFTTVKALKEAFTDTGLKLPNKTDESYKEKIIEKSTYLKKKFGLTEDETKNHEMYPVFKRLTTLYCLQDLVAFSFIQGETVSGGGDAPVTSDSLSLGKFSTKSSNGSSNGSSGSSSSGFLPDIIADQISIAEDDVKKSILLKSNKVYWYKKTRGEC